LRRKQIFAIIVIGTFNKLGGAELHKRREAIQ